MMGTFDKISKYFILLCLIYILVFISYSMAFGQGFSPCQLAKLRAISAQAAREASAHTYKAMPEAVRGRKNQTKMRDEILQSIDEGNSEGTILEAQNNLKDIRDGVQERLDTIEERLKAGEDEYSDY